MKDRKQSAVVLALSTALMVFLSGCTIGGPGSGGSPCTVGEGEWVPAQGECPGSDAETQQRCNTFCESHPDCCGGRTGPPGGQATLPLPSDADVAALTRSYPAIIKAIDEGPMIYSQNGPAAVISDATLARMKDTGFNTVQIMLIGSKAANGTIVFNEQNNAVLLNDIVAIKKAGMAAWIVIDMAGGGSESGSASAPYASYAEFKVAYQNLVRLSAPLMEEYKVEYFTPCNEQDKYFNEQTGWGTAGQVDGYLTDFYPAMNAEARTTFSGKLISKMTQPAKRDPAVTAVMIASADIAGVDVGPHIGDGRTMESYLEDFGDYQLYASAAEAQGVPWMNAEYWQGDFFADYPEFTRENQLAFANVSFNSYLAAEPRGVGYTWNDFSTFSLQPQGEATRLAIKEFFEKI